MAFKFQLPQNELQICNTVKQLEYRCTVQQLHRCFVLCQISDGYGCLVHGSSSFSACALALSSATSWCFLYFNSGRWLCHTCSSIESPSCHQSRDSISALPKFKWLELPRSQTVPFDRCTPPVPWRALHLLPLDLPLPSRSFSTIRCTSPSPLGGWNRGFISTSRTTGAEKIRCLLTA